MGCTVPSPISGEGILRVKGAGVVQFQEMCSQCRGTGTLGCYRCSGTGQVTVRSVSERPWEIDVWDQSMVTCPVCHGARGMTCPHCHGTGKEPEDPEKRRIFDDMNAGRITPDECVRRLEVLRERRRSQR